jgi:hypothetical protein
MFVPQRPRPEHHRAEFRQRRDCGRGGREEAMSPVVPPQSLGRLVQPRFLAAAGQVEPPSVHGDFAVGSPRPFPLGPIPIEFHAIVIGVTQVERLTDAVIAAPIKQDACVQHTTQGNCQRTPNRVQDRRVIKASRPRRGRRRMTQPMRLAMQRPRPGARNSAMSRSK